MSKTTCEDLWEPVRKLKELHREELQQLRPHQADMACQFWALTGAGIKGPTTAEEPEGQEKWHWEETPWEWRWEEWETQEPTENYWNEWGGGNRRGRCNREESALG